MQVARRPVKLGAAAAPICHSYRSISRCFALHSHPPHGDRLHSRLASHGLGTMPCRRADAGDGAIVDPQDRQKNPPPRPRLRPGAALRASVAALCLILAANGICHRQGHERCASLLYRKSRHAAPMQRLGTSPYGKTSRHIAGAGIVLAKRPGSGPKQGALAELGASAEPLARGKRDRKPSAKARS